MQVSSAHSSIPMLAGHGARPVQSRSRAGDVIIRLPAQSNPAELPAPTAAAAQAGPSFSRPALLCLRAVTGCGCCILSMASVGAMAGLAVGGAAYGIAYAATGGDGGVALYFAGFFGGMAGGVGVAGGMAAAIWDQCPELC